jgi:SAM-dependent methyltransferase
MSKSVEHELESLRDLIERFPIGDRPDDGGESSFGAGGEGAHDRSRDKLRWSELDRQLEGALAGRRVLVLGGDAIYDAQAFVARGSAFVQACVPADTAAKTSVNGDSGVSDAVRILPIAWADLDPARLGVFDVVHCHDLLHRVCEPLALLHALHGVTAPGGTLLIASMLLSDPERSEYLRFIPDGHAGDPDVRFIPGRLAFRWMLAEAGFEVESEFGEQEGPRDRLPVVSAYVRAVAAAPRLVSEF